MFQAILMLMMTTAAVDRDHDKVLALAPLVQITPSNENHIHYLLACSHHGLGRGDGAARYARMVLDSVSFPERRQEVIAGIILRDVATWNDGDLDDINRLMRRATDAIDNRRVAKATPIQNEILTKLDRLIEEAEKPSDQGAASDTPTPMPQDDSRPGGVSGKGLVDPKVLKQLTESWGTMPEKERAKVLAEVTRDVPDKYKPLVEAYFKSLRR